MEEFNFVAVGVAAVGDADGGSIRGIGFRGDVDGDAARGEGGVRGVEVGDLEGEVGPAGGVVWAGGGAFFSPGTPRVFAIRPIGLAPFRNLRANA